MQALYGFLTEIFILSFQQNFDTGCNFLSKGIIAQNDDPPQFDSEHLAAVAIRSRAFLSKMYRERLFLDCETLQNNENW